ncbi:MAG TPA: Asp-tRNA(Asn)/Glu-tRNA(Gln) amidotransferase subunit GatC [Flavobacteriales bacterium]|nr:Asp-tRNA(Asn)/Glu-tRNA(Gln) amidotransferase subunit GatC [Flavobacteriales bacterium]
MKIDEKALDRIAELSRLDLTDPAVRATRLADMQRVLDFVETLAQVDTTGVEPLIFMTEGEDVLRADEPAMEITKEQALANAPVKDSDYFKVPRVVG